MNSEIDPKSKDLFDAVQKGRLNEVMERLEVGEDVDAVDTMRGTALHIAAGMGHVKAVELLLQFTPDLKVQQLVEVLQLNSV